MGIVFLFSDGTTAQPFVLSIGDNKIEGTSLGLALIVLGLAAAGLALKDRKDGRKFGNLPKEVQELNKNIKSVTDFAGATLSRVADEKLSKLPSNSERKRKRELIRNARNRGRQAAALDIKLGAYDEIMTLSDELDNEL